MAWVGAGIFLLLPKYDIEDWIDAIWKMESAILEAKTRDRVHIRALEKGAGRVGPWQQLPPVPPIPIMLETDPTCQVRVIIFTHCGEEDKCTADRFEPEPEDLHG